MTRRISRFPIVHGRLSITTERSSHPIKTAGFARRFFLIYLMAAYVEIHNTR